MFFPEVIAYLLTLRYPGAETERMNWVCYRGGWQVAMPLVPPGSAVSYTIQPLYGVYAWFGYAVRFGTDIVPNAFTVTISQYGTTPYSGLLSQRIRDAGFEFFVLVTKQTPTYVSITNITPLRQRGEIFGDFIVIPSFQDMVTVTDALRRLHTSTKSEGLLQQAVTLLEVLAGKRRSPIGGD